MAYGDQYTHFANEKYATITDPDVRFIDTKGSVMVANLHYVVVKHLPLSMNRIPKVKVNGIMRALTQFPDGKFVNANRVSSTQSVLKNMTGDYALIEVIEGDMIFPSTEPEIGNGIIEQSFVVG